MLFRIISDFVYTLYKWLLFVPYVIVSTLVFGLLAVLLSFISTPKIAGLVGGKYWARSIGILTPIRVNVKGNNHIKKNQSYVIVANHQSQYDIIILYGWLTIDFKWVMKKELRKIPGLGIGSEKVGHIFIDRSSPKAAMESLEKAKKKIRNGTSIIFFPEGTRSSSGELKPFKKGAFKMALDLQLPLLPITVNGANKILPNGTFDLRPGKAEIIIHESVETTGYSASNMDELINICYKKISNGIK